MPVFLHAAIAVVLAWSAAIWLLYPVLRPSGDVNTRAKRGLQFSAYAASFVAGATATRAISNVDHVDLWIAVAVLTPLAWIAAFAVGYVVGPSSSTAASVPLSTTLDTAVAGFPSAMSSQAVATARAVAPATRASHKIAVVAATTDQTDSPLVASVNEDALFERVGVELESGQKVLATWTRAFAEANGDENKARALYIGLRVERLKAEQLERKLATAAAASATPLGEIPLPAQLVSAASPPTTSVHGESSPEQATLSEPKLAGVIIVVGFIFVLLYFAYEGPGDSRVSARSECHVSKSQADAIRKVFPDDKFGGTPINQLPDQQLIDWLCWHQQNLQKDQ